MSRKFPRKIKRVVVKVGSSVVATYQMKPRKAKLRSLAEQISQVMGGGVDVVLVSSGAVVVGMGEMNQTKRPKDLAGLQACASVGQAFLMRMYNEFFKKFDQQCGQILLTWDDFNDRQRFNNARQTIQALLKRKIVPIINENDAISTDEIKFGDNDKLAALVASMIQADLLLVLSDVEGLYDLRDGKKEIFSEIKEMTDEIKKAAFGELHGSEKKEMSSGGMSAKLEAVRIATQANIPAIIANGETENVLLRTLKGERIGTLFMESEESVFSRKHWISFGAKPQGFVMIDAGAKKALLKGGVSLLLPGIVKWQGNFKKSDVVVVVDEKQHEIARGLVNYSSGDLHSVANQKGQLEAIHYDNLVLSQR